MKTRKQYNINTKKTKSKRYKRTKKQKGGVNCDFLKDLKDSQDSQDLFKHLRVKKNYNISQMLQRIFPFEECKNNNNNTCDIYYCEKEKEKEKEKKQCVPKTPKTIIHQGDKKVETSGVLGQFAKNFAEISIINKNTNLYSYFQEQIKKLFDLPNDYKSNNVNKVSNNLLTWSDYLDIDIYKNNINKQNCKKNYYKFRKIVVDALIVMIIIALCKKNGKTNYEIKKGEISIYKTDTNNNDKLTIIYQSVGSETPKSDYDLTLYSIPVSEITPEITAIFNSSFLYGLGKTAGELFDTNLYSHIFYIYSMSKLNTVQTTQPFFLNLDTKEGINKYFLNSGHDYFHKNEILYANLILLEYTGNYNFEDLLKEQKFLETYKNTISNNSNNSNKFTIVSDSLFITQQSQYYSDLTLQELSLSKSNTKKNTNIISNNNNKSLNPKKCINLNNKPSSSTCKNFTDTGLDISSRLSVDTSTITLLSYLENDINNGNEKNLLGYINSMRLSLWFADETYHTFSAYFHVIHCVTIPGSNIKTINDLLTNNKKSFMNICKVSAIENFNFMFHYFKKDTAQFIKKTAKYLARLSHALAIIKMLKDNTNTNTQFILSESNLEEFKNFGNHTDITNIYKYGQNVNNQTNFSGLDFSKLKKILENITLPLTILQKIYNLFVNEDKDEYEDKGFNISYLDLIIKPNIN